MANILPFNGGPVVEGFTLDQFGEGLVKELIDEVEDKVARALRIGRLLSGARSLCDDPACGIDGNGSDQRFGNWLKGWRERSPIVGDRLPQQTAWNYRLLWDAFGHLPVEQVIRIGLTNAYKVAAAEPEAQAKVLALAAVSAEPLTGQLVRQLLAPEPAPRAAPAPQPTPRAPAPPPGPGRPDDEDPDDADDDGDEVPDDDEVMPAKPDPADVRQRSKPTSRKDALMRAVTVAGDDGVTLAGLRDYLVRVGEMREGDDHNIVKQAMMTLLLDDEVRVDGGRFRLKDAVDRSMLSASAQEKLDAALRRYQRQLEAGFRDAVSAEAQRFFDDIRVPGHMRAIADAKRVLDARKSMMTKSDYRLIRACLHPEGEINKERKEKAFLMFNDLEVVLLNEKDAPRTNGLPATVEELMQMRRKKT